MVIVEGPPTLVAEIDPGDVVPYVRVKEAPPKEGKVVEVSVDLPEGCAVAKVEPATVFVFNDSGRKVALKVRPDKLGKKNSK